MQRSAGHKTFVASSLTVQSSGQTLATTMSVRRGPDICQAVGAGHLDLRISSETLRDSRRLRTQSANFRMASYSLPALPADEAPRYRAEIQLTMYEELHHLTPLSGD